MDDRMLSDRFQSAFEVEMRPGLREQIRARLLATEVRADARPQVGRSRYRAQRFGFGSPSLQWAVGLVAVLVLVALLASLLYARGVLNRFVPALPPTTSPACFGQTTPPKVPFASADLQSVTGISDPQLMTPLDLEARIETQKITLVRAYADPLTTVLVFELDPTGSREWTLDLLHDDQGDKFSGGTGVFMPTDQYEALVYTLPGPRGYGKDGVAHLEVWLGLLTAAVPSGGTELVEDTGAGNAQLTFSLCVHPATSLSVPPAFRLGPGTVTIQSLRLSPAALRMHAVVSGLGDPPLYTGGNFSNFGLYRVDPPCPSLVDSIGIDITCLIDFATGQLGPQFGPLQGTSYSIDVGWLRPSAGNYVLVFRNSGSAHSTNLRIPAPGNQ